MGRMSSDPQGIRSAEMLAVGTELLLGETVDTNTAWLGGRLARAGVDVYWSQRVGDNLARVRAALEQGLARSDLVVCCGGLGPTDDDLTREAIAELIGETPRVDPELEEALRARFAARGRAMSERNLKQAWRIPSAEVLPNPLGTAPGWLVRTELEGGPRWIAALPGPPVELEAMAERELLPRLPLPQDRLHVRTLKTLGLGESDVAERLAELTDGANPSVATYAKRDGVHVRVAAKAADAEAARRLAAPVEREVAARLAGHVWGEDADELAERLAASLLARGSSLALVEDATGGRLSDAFSSAPSGRGALRGAVIAWSAEAMATLGVRGGAGERSESRAVEVAEAARAYFAADVAIAVGELRPEEDGNAGTRAVTIALSDARGTQRHEVRLPELGAAGSRERLVASALFLLWRRLGHD